MRRDDVASTLIRRHFRTKCPLGKSCNQYNLFFFLLKSCSINEEVKSTSLVGFGVTFFFLSFLFFFFFLSFTLQAGSGERQRILREKVELLEKCFEFFCCTRLCAHRTHVKVCRFRGQEFQFKHSSNIFYCLCTTGKKGWVTGSHNISYSPSPPRTLKHIQNIQHGGQKGTDVSQF